MDHCHTGVPTRRPHVDKAKRKLSIACGLCLLFITGEVTGGYLSGSLAIMSDAAHMFSDFTSFLIRLLKDNKFNFKKKTLDNFLNSNCLRKISIFNKTL